MPLPLRYYLNFASVAIVLSLGGCQSAHEAQSSKRSEASPSQSAGQAPSSPPPASAPQVAAAAAAAPAEAGAASSFTPLFPERTELFEPQQRIVRTTQLEVDSGRTVQLKGFINVSGYRAILSIDGQIAPIAAGDEKHGVQVISIDPPSATLQRGRNRWTATLE